MKLIPDTLLFPASVISGHGSAIKLPAMCEKFGEHGIIAHGASIRENGYLDKILDSKPAAMKVSLWQHPGGEPVLENVSELIGEAKKCKVQWIAAVGGGSVIDVAKAAAGLFNSDGDIESYHDGLKPSAPGIPFAAAPATAGTGSEATPNSVLTNKKTNCKKSIRDDSYMAGIVALDPGLLESCPQKVMAASGMDAFTQAVEAFTSKKSSWLTDTLALRGAILIAQNLEKACYGDKSVLEGLMEGSFLAGVALCNARLGVVHGLAHPLGARYNAPHGVVCAVCLPHVINFNRTACNEKYEQLERAIGMETSVFATQMLGKFNIKSPFAGKTVLEKDAIIEETCASGSTAANPRTVSARDVELLLEQIFSLPS